MAFLMLSAGILTDFAASKGLQAYALRQWQDYLSLNDYRLMGVPFEKPQGVEGVYGYHATADLPSPNFRPSFAPSQTPPPQRCGVSFFQRFAC